MCTVNNIVGIEQDPELTLKPSEIMDDDETIDLETFRADLHKMIEEVYAESPCP